MQLRVCLVRFHLQQLQGVLRLGEKTSGVGVPGAWVQGKGQDSVSPPRGRRKWGEQNHLIWTPGIGHKDPVSTQLSTPRRHCLSGSALEALISGRYGGNHRAEWKDWDGEKKRAQCIGCAAIWTIDRVNLRVLWVRIGAASLELSVASALGG